MTKSRVKYSCDFETTTLEDDCRVWAWAYMEIGNIENYMIGRSIDEFMEFCEMTKADLYFHNLRFDGEFIVNWLLHNGFTYSDEPQDRTFKTIISSMGQWYKIEIVYKKTEKFVHKTVIYDSLKKLPFPVKRIAKAFDLPILKGDIDYHKPRPIGYFPDKEERAYIKNDVEIIARALEIQFNEGLIKMTTGSDSLNGYKLDIGSKFFKNHFPVLSLELDAEIREAYKGGFTWLNSRFANKDIDKGIVFDVNSLYPSQMRYRLLPYGQPSHFVGKYEVNEKYPLFIQKMTCRFELNEGYIPTIQIKKNLAFRQNEYLKSSGLDEVEICLTNVDMELFFEHYTVTDVQYHGGWMFKGKTGMFDSFIDKWMKVKIKETGALKELAKLMLNSLYGKFASNPDVTGKYPYLKEDGSTGLRLKDKEFKDPVYTPMGTFITAWARHTCISTAQKCFDRIIYCDTDSIHLTGLDFPDAILDVIDKDKLGYWKYEGAFKRGKYLRQKTYYHVYYAKKESDGKLKQCDENEATDEIHSVKCAGMPDKVKSNVTYDTFKIGFSSYGKLLPKHVFGGVVLVDTAFSIT